MAPEAPEAPTSSIQDAQRTRAVVDAVVQAGFTARMAFSLAAGLAGEAANRDDDELRELAQEAQAVAERAKNADMSLDMALAGDQIASAGTLEEAAQALSKAARAYEAAANIQRRLAETGDEIPE